MSLDIMYIIDLEIMSLVTIYTYMNIRENKPSAREPSGCMSEAPRSEDDMAESWGGDGAVDSRGGSVCREIVCGKLCGAGDVKTVRVKSPCAVHMCQKHVGKSV